MRSTRVKKTLRKPSVRRRGKRVLRFGSFWKKGQGVFSFRRFIPSLVGLCVIISVPIGLWMAGFVARFYEDLCEQGQQVAKITGFQVREVVVHGRNRVDALLLAEALGLTVGDSIFKRSPEDIRGSLEQLTGIKSAVVQRQLPGRFSIYVAERSPIAVWQHQQQFFLIDDLGVVIAPVIGARPEEFILVVGKDAPLQAPAFLKILGSFPKIRVRASSVSSVNGRRWNIILDGSIEVRLPEKGVEKALAQLDLLMEEKKLGSDDVYTIDLRLTDRMAMRLSPSAMARFKIKGKET